MKTNAAVNLINKFTIKFQLLPQMYCFYLLKILFVKKKKTSFTHNGLSSIFSIAHVNVHKILLKRNCLTLHNSNSINRSSCETQILFNTKINKLPLHERNKEIDVNSSSLKFRKSFTSTSYSYMSPSIFVIFIFFFCIEFFQIQNLLAFANRIQRDKTLYIVQKYNTFRNTVQTHVRSSVSKAHDTCILAWYM